MSFDKFLQKKFAVASPKKNRRTSGQDGGGEVAYLVGQIGQVRDRNQVEGQIAASIGGTKKTDQPDRRQFRKSGRSKKRRQRQPRERNQGQCGHGCEIARQGGGVAGECVFQLLHLNGVLLARFKQRAGCICCHIVLKFRSLCKELFENIREQNRTYADNYLILRKIFSLTD